MEVKAEVLSIAKLSDYFFVVPDYQREYVWTFHFRADAKLWYVKEIVLCNLFVFE